MSLKRKRDVIADQNQNAQIVPLSPSGETDFRSSEEIQETKVFNIDSD